MSVEVEEEKAWEMGQQSKRISPDVCAANLRSPGTGYGDSRAEQREGVIRLSPWQGADGVARRTRGI